MRVKRRLCAALPIRLRSVWRFRTGEPAKERLSILDGLIYRELPSSPRRVAMTYSDCVPMRNLPPQMPMPEVT